MRIKFDKLNRIQCVEPCNVAKIANYILGCHLARLLCNTQDVFLIVGLGIQTIVCTVKLKLFPNLHLRFSSLDVVIDQQFVLGCVWFNRIGIELELKFYRIIILGIGIPKRWNSFVWEMHRIDIKFIWNSKFFV